MSCKGFLTTYVKTLLFLLSQLVWIKGDNEPSVFLKGKLNARMLVSKVEHTRVNNFSSAPFEMRQRLREKLRKLVNIR